LFENSGGLSEIDIRQLYEAVFPLLQRIAYRITANSEAAEDVVHDSFIRFVEKAPPFATKDDAKYWLIRVVKNNALNYAKRKYREGRAYERYFKESKTESASAETEVLREEGKSDMQRYLSMLPEKLKTVLVLKEYGMLNYKEIAKTLGITEGNVKVRVFRAREALLDLMRKEHGNVS
jgi:RNA polymerase sigma-70 factor (ECF subfamily)